MLDLKLLDQLYDSNKREVFVKIISLNFDETPREEITGRVTQGSVSVDGTSAVRRTCSLTIIAQELGIHEYYWGLNTKFKLYVGMKNDIDFSQPEIIWIPLGLYLITSFNTNQTLNSYQISIQGKDKMCLLNGDINGSIVAKTVDFGIITEVTYKVDENGKKVVDSITEEKIPIKTIIKEVVHEYAKEPYHNIIINDLDEMALSMVELENADGVKEKIGYVETPLVYAGELIGQVGNSVTSSCLDKIRDMLGDFEYFYNLEGQFVFQRKHSFINKSWNSLRKSDDEKYAENSEYVSPYIYSFFGGNLVTSFQNQPNLLNVRNDFAIWGTRQTSTGADIDFHLRYAIDSKKLLQEYKSYNYKEDENGSISGYYTINMGEDYSQVTEEREEAFRAYQSAINEYSEAIEDYSNAELSLQTAQEDYDIALENHHTNNTSSTVIQLAVAFEKLNKAKDELKSAEENRDSAKEATKGPWPFFERMCGDWREILYQMAADWFQNGQEEEFYTKLYENNPNFINGITGYEQYYTDIYSFWRDIYDPVYNSDVENGWKISWDEENSCPKHPEDLTFWFDFLDTEGEISKYSVKNIGSRTKSISSSTARVIDYPPVPLTVYRPQGASEDNQLSGYDYDYNKTQDEIDAMTIPVYASAKQELDNLLYNYSYCAESISLSVLPVYHLEPNYKILVKDDNSGINGEYIINRLTIPLNYNGMMTINATKAVDRLY